MDTPTTSFLRLGLRFSSSQTHKLQALLTRAQARDITESPIVFATALQAARTGEPLILECKNIHEARHMLASYIRYGIRPPTIETLNG